MSSDEQNASSSDGGVLQQNCREAWPGEVCTFANICGLCSSAIWFVVLFPQLWKNFRRKSVRGLSFLWAVANFSSDLVNTFFVFKLMDLPIYIKLQAVYQPTMELVMLGQFWRYSGSLYSRQRKMVVVGLCAVGWGALIAVQLMLDIHHHLQWIAVVLWSTQSFPQVILNMKVQSTGGQANKSIMLSLVGKTTDFLSCYLLVLPVQYVIMAYFSSSVAYVNGLQMVWYWGQQGKLKEGPRQEPQVEDAKNHQEESKEAVKDGTDDIGGQRSKATWTLYVRIAAFGLLCMILTGFVAGLVWNMWTPLAVLPPFSIVVVLLTAYSYLHRYGPFSGACFESKEDDGDDQKSVQGQGDPQTDPLPTKVEVIHF